MFNEKGSKKVNRVLRTFAVKGMKPAHNQGGNCLVQIRSDGKRL